MRRFRGNGIAPGKILDCILKKMYNKKGWYSMVVLCRDRPEYCTGQIGLAESATTLKADRF